MISSTDKTPLQSKKWIAMMLGVICAMVVFLVSMLSMTIKVEVADNISAVANTVVAFLGAMVSILITGQSAVDWRHDSGRSTSKSRDFIEEKQEELNSKNEIVDEYREKHKDDDSYRPINPQEEKWQ